MGCNRYVTHNGARVFALRQRWRICFLFFFYDALRCFVANIPLLKSRMPMVDVHVEEIVSNALLIRTHLGKMMNRLIDSIFILSHSKKYLLANFLLKMAFYIVCIDCFIMLCSLKYRLLENGLLRKKNEWFGNRFSISNFEWSMSRQTKAMPQYKSLGMLSKRKEQKKAMNCPNNPLLCTKWVFCCPYEYLSNSSKYLWALCLPIFYRCNVFLRSIQ